MRFCNRKVDFKSGYCGGKTLANIKSAAKRARQFITRKNRNQQRKKAVRTLEKRLRTTIAGGNKEESSSLFQQYSSMIAKAAQKGAFHKNMAARKVSRIATLMNK